MKKIFLAFLLITSVSIYGQTYNFNISVTDSLREISPYIYGTNQSGEDVNNTFFRIGGNRLTGYNWENNASHAGTDYYNSSDNYLPWVMGIESESNVPASVMISHHENSLSQGANSLVTLQMAGYVAKDKDGTVTEGQTAPSSRWNQAVSAKGSDFSLNPDLTDNYVYMDELVNKLVNEFGYAGSETGIFAYCLDNEPALWPSTHPRLHPAQATCNEVVNNGIELSMAVKNVDAGAKIFGPVFYGFSAYYNLQDAPDWPTVSNKKGYDWFIDYYLDEFKKAETAQGKRLLDVLDLHWYPEAKGDNRISDNTSNSENDVAARLQAPRSLWDNNYTENSWIGQWFSDYLPLLPKVKQSIDKYYPGTKIAITEFTYGGEDNISGAITTADVLGIFGKYDVYAASFWAGNENSSYIYEGYKIFRNYDGNKSVFGNLYVPSVTSDSVNSSVYSSISSLDNKFHIIAINKSSETATANFNINQSSQIFDGKVWCLDGTQSSIRQLPDAVNITDNSFSYQLPALSICHFIFENDVPFDVELSKPENFEIEVNSYPNPFNNSLKIEYSIPSKDFEKIEIFDISGKTVKTYLNPAKSGVIEWDGKDNNGNLTASGVYNVAFFANKKIIASSKIMLLK